MKANDPRLTAYALGELSADETREVRAAILKDKSLADELEQIRSVVGMLHETFGQDAEHKLSSDQRATVFAAGSAPKVEDIKSIYARNKWRSLAIGSSAAAAVVFGVLFIKDGFNSGGSALDNGTKVDFAAISPDDLTRPMHVDQGDWKYENGASISSTNQGVVKAMSHQSVDFKQEVAKRMVASAGATMKGEYAEAKWLNTADQRSVTFPMISGNASWQWVKHSLEAGKLPSPNAVRAEELVNAFSYPSVDGLKVEGINVAVEVVESPWKAGNLVAVMQFQNQSGTTIHKLAAGMTAGKDIEKFRIVGYRSEQQGTVKATEALHAQAGFSHTLVVEMQPKQPLAANSTAFTMHLHAGDGKVKAITAKYHPTSWEQSSASTQFVIGVATWSQLLGHSGTVAEMSIPQFSEMVTKLEAATDFSAEQQKAVKLMRKSAELMGQ